MDEELSVFALLRPKGWDDAVGWLPLAWYGLGKVIGQLLPATLLCRGGGAARLCGYDYAAPAVRLLENGGLVVLAALVVWSAVWLARSRYSRLGMAGSILSLVLAAALVAFAVYLWFADG